MKHEIQFLSFDGIPTSFSRIFSMINVGFSSSVYRSTYQNTFHFRIFFTFYYSKFWKVIFSVFFVCFSLLSMTFDKWSIFSYLFIPLLRFKSLLIGAKIFLDTSDSHAYLKIVMKAVFRFGNYYSGPFWEDLEILEWRRLKSNREEMLKNYLKNWLNYKRCLMTWYTMGAYFLFNNKRRKPFFPSGFSRDD